MGVDHRDADRQALPLRFGNGRRDAALGMLQRQVGRHGRRPHRVLAGQSRKVEALTEPAFSYVDFQVFLTMNRRDPLAGLHVFRQVADTGSFTRAAALLGVTPAAVSQAINQLEAELRLKLFHRTTRGVSLSEAGQRYHEQTEQPYRDLVRAREALGESLAEPSGQLRISALHLAKNLVIAPMLNEFVRRYPKVQLEIRYEDQLVDIVRERLDAGIRLADALQPGMVGVQLTAPLACLLVATPTYLAEYGCCLAVACRCRRCGCIT